MDSLLHTRNQSSVKTMDFYYWTCTKEDKNVFIGKKGHGHRFLGFKRNDSHRLLGEEKNIYWHLLYRTIWQIWWRVEEKTSSFSTQKVLFHHDNVSAHSSAIATAKLVGLRYVLLSHPYSPDLAPCDFFLFPNMKTWLAGKKFSSNSEL